jgi:hypothetical protein
MPGTSLLRAHKRAAVFITAISAVVAACFFAVRALPAAVRSIEADQGFVTHQGSTLLAHGHFTSPASTSTTLCECHDYASDQRGLAG